MRKWRITLRLWVARAYQSLVFTSVEAFLALLSIMVGVPILLHPTGVAPESIQAALPIVVVVAWAAGMVSGGVLTLGGIVTSAIRIERAGAWLLANTTGIYGFIIVVNFGRSASLLAITYGLFATAMFARFYVLGHVLSIIQGLPYQVRTVEGRTLRPVRVAGRGWVYVTGDGEGDSL